VVLDTKKKVADEMSAAFRAGDYQECLDVAVDECSARPDDCTAWRYRGMALVELDRPNEALEIFGQGIDVAEASHFASDAEAELPRLMVQRGRLYLQLRQGSDALKDLQQAMNLA
ncbi:unnamed protein product, partial [Phaeothamnion confervicola]